MGGRVIAFHSTFDIQHLQFPCVGPPLLRAVLPRGGTVLHRRSVDAALDAQSAAAQQRGAHDVGGQSVRSRLRLRIWRGASADRDQRHHSNQPGAAAGAGGVRRRSFERLIFPAVLTVVLFTVYLPFSNKPLMVPAFGDVTRYVEFGAFTALIFFAVRLVDVLIFDVAVARRREVAAPQLLRGIVAIVLYVLLFAALFQQVLNYDVKRFITGTAFLALVLALALQ